MLVAWCAKQANHNGVSTDKGGGDGNSGGDSGSSGAERTSTEGQRGLSG